MGSIQLKTGQCIDCPPGTSDRPLINKRCAFYHYKIFISNKAKAKAGPVKKKRKKIKKVSDKEAARLAKYYPIRDKHLEDNPICELQIKCEGAEAVDVHHAAGRRGDNLYKHLKSTCRACHDNAHNDSKGAIEKGHSISRLKK